MTKTHITPAANQPDLSQLSIGSRPDRQIVLYDRSAATIAGDGNLLSDVANFEKELQIRESRVGQPVTGFLRVHNKTELRNILVSAGEKFDLVCAYSAEKKLVGACGYFTGLDNLDDFNQGWIEYLRQHLQRFPKLKQKIEEGHVGLVDMAGVARSSYAQTGWRRGDLKRILQQYCVHEMLGEKMDILLAVVRFGRAGNPALRKFITQDGWKPLALAPYPDPEKKYKEAGISWAIIAIDVRSQKPLTKELDYRRKTGEVIIIDLDADPARPRLEHIPQAEERERARRLVGKKSRPL
jgi:hypothetical protein